MGAPASFPDFDTNGTHTTPITSGHTTDGFAEDEIPDSDEMNQWMMLVGLWIRYFAGGLSDVLNLLPISGQVSTTVAASDYFNSAGQFFPQSIHDELVLDIPLHVGDSISQVQGFITDSSFSTFEWDFALWKQDVQTAGSPTQVGATQTSSGTGGPTTPQTLTIGSLTETIATNMRYFMTFTPHSGSSSFGTARVCGAQVTCVRH